MITTLVLGETSLILRVASMPLMPAALEHDVHQHDVGQQLAADLDRALGVVHGVGDHRERAVEADDGRQRIGEDLVVVADQ